MGQHGSALRQRRATRSYGVFRSTKEPLICPIHLDTLTSPVTTKCGHTFCRDCLHQCFLRSSECPLCRLRLSPDEVFDNNVLNQQLRKQIHISSNSPSPSFKGHTKLEPFVAPVPTCFLCPFSPPHVLANPVLTSCGTSFCESCTEGLETRSRCPTCSQYHTATYPNRGLREQIDCLVLRCSNQNCGAQFTFSERLVHESTCEWTMVPCPNSPLCCANLRRQDLEEHQLICQFIPCPHKEFGCSFVGPKDALRTHLADSIYEHMQVYVSATRAQHTSSSSRERHIWSSSALKWTVCAAIIAIWLLLVAVSRLSVTTRDLQMQVDDLKDEAARLLRIACSSEVTHPDCGHFRDTHGFTRQFRHSGPIVELIFSLFTLPISLFVSSIRLVWGLWYSIAYWLLRPLFVVCQAVALMVVSFALYESHRRAMAPRTSARR
eukprot:GILJ01012317.1.p1 GENE.GILJ01012317.1~~GILJ01012317.1.p1  ORF type:complete len:435 (-),score=11.54 GILJ01012317.1:176-1480(-)